MKSILKVVSFLSLFIINEINASGFRLSEQSLNGTALNSAFVAGAYGADSTYYNPANMSLDKDSDKWEFEANVTTIFIPAFNFDTENRNKGINVESSGGPFGAASQASGHFCESNGNSQHTGAPNKNAICGSERVEGNAPNTIQPIPRFFFKTKALKINDLKLNAGISFTTPSGLSMKWGGEGGGFLKDVGIAMMELNPVVSIGYKDLIAIGGGYRILYSFGDFSNTLYVPFKQSMVVSSGSVINLPVTINSYGTTRVEQDSSAAGFGYGYNLAATIKPFGILGINNSLENMRVSVTYRSNVHTDLKGNLSAKSYIYQGKKCAIVILGICSGDTNVAGYVGMDADLVLATDLPPILNVAISQDFGNHRFEFVWERTFWGQAKIFEFGYANQVFDKSHLTGSSTALGQIKPEEMLDAADYSAVAYGNGWKDSNAYRLGYTYFGKTFKIMGSLAYDETPAPQGKFGIPDADAYMFGLGFRKRFFNDKLDIGAGYSLALKDNRKSFIVSHNGFGQLHLLTIGAKYLW